MERIKRKGRDAKIALRAAPISEEMNEDHESENKSAEQN